MAGRDREREQEFVDFFAGEYWPLRRVGFLLTGNWHEADELAQDAFAWTYAAWGRLRQPDRAAAYARKVLVNRHRSLGHGPACHLRLTLQATVENADGTPLRVPGTPATTTIEGDLPEDGAGPLSPSQPDLRVPDSSTLHWIFSWENWCRQPLGQIRVRITAAGRSATQSAPKDGYGNCRNVSPTAPWRIVPLL